MKNEFDILNDVKNDIDNIKDINLNEDDKKNISNRVLNKINKPKKIVNRKRIIAAALMLALTGSFIITNESVLATINGMGRKIESFLEREEDVYKKYKDDILLVTEDKGIKFILNEVILDDGQLFISTTVDYKEFDRSTLKTDFEGDLNIIPPTRDDNVFDIHLDGKVIDLSGSGADYRYNDNKTVDILFNKKIRDNFDLSKTYTIKFKTDNMEVQVPDIVEKEKASLFSSSKSIKQQSTQVMENETLMPEGNNEFISGNWEIDFNIDGSKIANDMKVIDINKPIEIDYKGIGLEILVEELRISPISMTFKYKLDEGITEIWDKNMNLEFEFVDENNKKIDFISQGGSSNSMSYKYMIDKDIKKIKAIPVITKYNTFALDKKFKSKAIEIEIK